MDEETQNDLLGLTAEIVSAHVSNNAVAAAEVAQLIAQVHGALATLAAPPAAAAPPPEPAVPVRASIRHDYLVCLEDGKKLKMLKRYLRTNYGMSPEQYREKWNLPRDYPMVAPAYAEQRRGLAEKIGLGRRRDGGGEAEGAGAGPAEAAQKPARPRGRPRKAAAPADA